MTTVQDAGVGMTASTARELADALQESGAVRSPWLRRAFAQTPREVFVPRFYRVENGQDVLVDPTVPERRAEWLRGVYTDEALVVQVTPAPDFGGPECLPTSSSSMPTVMAGMLEALDLRPGHRVLEIGTGTGYNAALVRHEAPPFPCGDERSPPPSCRSRLVKLRAV